MNDFAKNFIDYQTNPIEQNHIRQWRLRAQPYLSSLMYLINKISKLKKTDSPYALDDIYRNFHRQKTLYKAYLLATS